MNITSVRTQIPNRKKTTSCIIVIKLSPDCPTGVSYTIKTRWTFTIGYIILLALVSKKTIININFYPLTV